MAAKRAHRAKAAFAFLFLIAVFVLAGLAVFRALHSSVNREFAKSVRKARPLEFVSAGAARVGRVEMFSEDQIEGVAVLPDGLYLATSEGVSGPRPLTPNEGAPSLSASAVGTWRRRPVAAFARGGWFRGTAAGWQEASTGWGELQVRAFAESRAGVLWVGARQGLFRAVLGEPELERIDTHPVRSIELLSESVVLFGGEEGLFQWKGLSVRPILTPDSWIESVWFGAPGIVVETPSGIFFSNDSQGFAAHPAGSGVAGGVLWGEEFIGISGESVVRLKFPNGRRGEGFPAVPRKLMRASGSLFCDTDRGLYRSTRRGWVLERRRGAAAMPGRHVTALLSSPETLVAGFFDGGAASLARNGRWRAIPAGDTWGVNALAQTGGVLSVASLRGAHRLGAGRLSAVAGAGASFAFAVTTDGLATGTAQGVLLPQGKLLSAFHGLPGNQTLALAFDPSEEALWVGTPSGLGKIAGNRVVIRVGAGEGKLPHPWVTSLLLSREALYVGTYGGGVVRREKPIGAGGRETLPSPGPSGAARGRSDNGRYVRAVETDGLKVNAGCLIEAFGRLIIGTSGRGLWSTAPGSETFARVRAPLPSVEVSALAFDGERVWVGTDEGLAKLKEEDFIRR